MAMSVVVAAAVAAAALASNRISTPIALVNSASSIADTHKSAIKHADSVVYNKKALTQGRTDRSSNILADCLLKLRFPVQVCFSADFLNFYFSINPFVASGNFSSCDPELLPTTSNITRFDLNSAKMHQHAKYLGQRSFRSKAISFGHTDT